MRCIGLIRRSDAPIPSVPRGRGPHNPPTFRGFTVPRFRNRRVEPQNHTATASNHPDWLFSRLFGEPRRCGGTTVISDMTGNPPDTAGGWIWMIRRIRPRACARWPGPSVLLFLVVALFERLKPAIKFGNRVVGRCLQPLELRQRRRVHDRTTRLTAMRCMTFRNHCHTPYSYQPIVRHGPEPPRPHSGLALTKTAPPTYSTARDRSRSPAILHLAAHG